MEEESTPNSTNKQLNKDKYLLSNQLEKTVNEYLQLEEENKLIKSENYILKIEDQKLKKK